MLTLGVSSGLALACVRLLAARGPISGRAAGIATLRWWPLAAACVALQWYLALGPGLEWPAPWRAATILATQAAVTAVALANLRLRWMSVLAAGLLMNLVVMAANGGLMPVSPETLARSGNGHVLQRVGPGQPLPRSKDVILPVEQTRLALLSDVLVLPGRPGSFSPGDVLIAAGAFLVLQAAVAAPRAAGAAARPS
jgi:hypothetical protein